MKIRQGFVSNSSSSSFIIHLNKPIEEHSIEEFRLFLELNCRQFNDADEEKGVEQLFNAVLNGKQTELDRFSCPYTYQIVLGDLCDMEEVEEAYSLMQDFHTVFIGKDMVKIANKNIVIIDLGCDIG